MVSLLKNKILFLDFIIRIPVFTRLLFTDELN